MRSLPLTIPVGRAALAARLTLPDPCRAGVIVVHGSGSSHRSPRNRRVASVLEQAGLATLLFDLLSPEEQLREQPWDLQRLTDRLQETLRWWGQCSDLEPDLPLGLFASSSGAALALGAAAARPQAVGAIVCRGGRPDLASEALPLVHAPTLLIVGERDPLVLALNRQALARLAGPHRLVVVPGAGHLFEEPGGLEAVGLLARDWFLRWLCPPPPGVADRSSAPCGISSRGQVGPVDPSQEA